MSIAQNYLNILKCKSDIKDAIEAKGVTVGNIPLDQYAGKIDQISGGGGFRCTNKHINNVGVPPFYSFSNTTYQYTFDGELESAGIAILKTGDECPFVAIPLNSSTIDAGICMVTPGALVFQDFFNNDRFSIGPTNTVLVSQTLHMTDSYNMDCTLSINNNGLLTYSNTGSTTVQVGFMFLLVIFKGTDGTYDYDMVEVVPTDND